MNQILIIIGLCFANIVFYLIMNRLKSHKLVELVFLIGFTITTYYILRNIDRNSLDSFFFEVSEGRKKCLEEQVLPIFNRSAGCCGKGTKGGIPARYTYPDLFDPNPDDKWQWERTDAFDDESSITPPTTSCSSSGFGY
jgi:hypothetical protein